MSRSSTVMPEALWAHRLFRGSAEFVDPPSPLAVARVEARLRRIRRMPSAGDQAAPKIIAGLQNLAEWAGSLAEKLPPDPALQNYRAARARIEQFLAMPDDAAGRPAILRGLGRLVPSDCAAFLPPPDAGADVMRDALWFLDFILLDNCLCAMPAVRKLYLRRVYRMVADALKYNTTTDAPRMLPALAWARHLLLAAGARSLDYVDVGCAFEGGAPALNMAARVLRPDGLCRAVHGVDVSTPPPDLQKRLWLEHRVGIYCNDPVSRPLPRRYDVIMLANMHRHLNRALQWQLFDNLFRSLDENGRLFITWRFDLRDNPCVCLIRRNAAFSLAGDVNLV